MLRPARGIAKLTARDAKAVGVASLDGRGTLLVTFSEGRQSSRVCMTMKLAPRCSAKVVHQMTEEPLREGELTTCVVLSLHPMLARVTTRGRSGVIRGSVAKLSVGQHAKVIILAVNEGDRFEARLLGDG